jgi:hypothetical protein
MSQSSASNTQKAPEPEAQYCSDAYDVDPKGEIIIYAYGRQLKF